MFQGLEMLMGMVLMISLRGNIKMTMEAPTMVQLLSFLVQVI